ncbi:hypothetical protein DFJ77DRAFT_429568 [Powellomyces hirtus]|nr:hypothetical protein DFJ77DRAFT_429568 [Powellomyces hirtus]
MCIHTGLFIGYSTYKVVKVKDRYLGILYYGSVICIFGYIFYSIFSQELYLKKSPPTAGFVRASVRLRPEFSTVTPPYCVISPPLEGNNTFGGCLKWTAEQIAFPYDGELDTVFLTTRVTMGTTPPPTPPCTNYWTSPACLPPSYDELKKTTPTQTFYVANVEDLTIRVDHGVLVRFGNSFLGPGSQTLSSKQMYGSMSVGCGSGATTPPRLAWGEEYRTNRATANHLDTFTLRDLIMASNCTEKNLDLQSLAMADGARDGENLRSSGFVISAPIIYSSAKLGGETKVTYQYVPAQIPETEYKVTESIVQPDGSIMYLVRHGIRIVFTQTGEIGAFDFMSLLTSLVAATALLRVASLIVEFLMLWVMPHKHLYMKAKFENTADFSDIRDRLEAREENEKLKKKMAFMATHNGHLPEEEEAELNATGGAGPSMSQTGPSIPPIPAMPSLSMRSIQVLPMVEHTDLKYDKYDKV